MRKIEGKMFKISTYSSVNTIIETTMEQTEDERNIIKELDLSIFGYKFDLFMYLADLTIKGYAIASVSEFNVDGTKPKVAYANDKDFKKILKYIRNK